MSIIVQNRKVKLKTDHFLWPVASAFNGLKHAYKRGSIERIEKKLRQMFPTGYPVLCTSGRAALFMAVSESNVTRSNTVGIFPYASHCVLDAVSRIASPLTGPTWISADVRVVYHQWGYVQEKNLLPNTIEDSVDTLCVPGTALFPGGGAFEIWSLPKILGTTSGGVLWCRDEDTAILIREKRDRGNTSGFQWLTRLLMQRFTNLYDRWQGAESKYRKVSAWQTGEIWSAILQWDNFVRDRKIKLDLAWPLAIHWLQKPVNRLPTVVPVDSNMTDQSIKQLGLAAGYRMMEQVKTDGSRALIKVVPLPIHQQVTINDLKHFIQSLNA